MLRFIDRLARRVQETVPVLLVRQAGGIVVRRTKRGGVRILLVTSRHNRGRWVLPKGTIKRGESAADAALRETREEAGVRGKVVGRAGTARYGNGRGLVRIEYFLIAFRGPSAGPHEERRVEWHSIDEALEMLSNAHVRRVLAESRELVLAAAEFESR
jgi:8-oxo-dGTP pyrophosphatase MutT (NUDIX family)